MGCSSSRAMKRHASADSFNPSFARSISMPAHRHHQLQVADDFHIVALTSSTYGILMVDPPKPTEEETKAAVGPAEPMKEMLNKLNSLETAADSAPQSWLEVSSMLENLKPGLEKNSTKVGVPAGVGKIVGKFGSQQAGKPAAAIDIQDVMDGLDDDTTASAPPPPSKAVVAAAPLRKPKPFDKSIPIHTLEELDARLEEQKSPLHTSLLNDQGPSGKENAKPSGSSFKGRSGANGKDSVAGSKVVNSAPKSLSTATNALKDGKVPSPIVRSGNAYSDPSSAQNPNSKASAIPASNTEASARFSSTSHGLLQSNGSLFDADFLASYQKAFKNLSQDDWSAVESLEDSGIESDSGDSHVSEAPPVELESSKPEANVQESKVPQQALPDEVSSPKPAPSKIALLAAQKKKKPDPLEKFEKLCPPGGEKTVVLYTTSLRGIRKTFEDCNRVRGILESFSISIDERDVSMHLEFRNELRQLMGKVVTVPRLFIKGRYIGGEEEVSQLNEEEKLAGLLEGLPTQEITGKVCDGCGGARFVPCLECSGSCKVVDADKEVVRCPDCNENGLIQCPICS